MPKFIRMGRAAEFERGIFLHRQSLLVRPGDVVEVNTQVAKQFKQDRANWRPVIDARRASLRRRKRERGGRRQW